MQCESSSHIAFGDSDMASVCLDKISQQTAEYALLTGYPRVASVGEPAPEIAAIIRPYAEVI